MPYWRTVAYTDGHIRCYNVSQICSYRLSEESHLLPCRTGQHLENCQKMECNAKYKCPDYYCIPFSYVCDGKWDCPYGNDELSINCVNGCPHFFKCKSSNQCIHYMDICDKETDCPLGDDEDMCSLIAVDCVKDCDCLGFTIICINITNSLITTAFPFSSVHIHDASDLSIKTMLYDANFISILNLKKNALTLFCYILPSLAKMLIIDLSFNLIQYIANDCFENAIYLRKLSLDNNNITKIFDKAFYYLPSLHFLNLSYNNLNCITFTIIQNENNLFLFDIRENNFENICINQISHMKVTFLLTDNFYHCCTFSLETNCINGKPWHFSCKNIVSEQYAKIAISLSLSCILVLNIFCLALQMSSHKSHKVRFEKIIATINVIDISYALYLIILLFSQYYRNPLVWTSSPLCLLAFSLFFNYNICSPVLLSISAFCRLMVTKCPMEVRFKEPIFFVKLIVISLTISGLATTFFCMTMIYNGLPISSPLCMPFFDPLKMVVLTKYTLYIIMSFKVFIIIIISIMYIFIFVELQRSEKKVQRSLSKLITNETVLVQICCYCHC